MDDRRPEGVITLLLTDVVGSTRSWEAHPREMAAALARHDALIADVVAAHDGTLIKRRGEGDATFSVFTRATDAAAAAVALQQAMAAEPWPEPIALSVRVALHTGEAELRDGDYYGTTVNRAARLRSVATGGQILCSQATAGVIADSLPQDAALTDHGSQLLKDLTRPEHIFSLQWPGAVTGGPAGRTEVAPVRPFVGRARELEVASRCLAEAMTGHGGALLIAGEPGIGKTRLAERVEERATSLGAEVVWGRCLEEEGTPPFWPWRQVLRGCLAGAKRDELVASIGPAVSDLAAIVPDLALQEDPASATPAGPPSGGEERFRLFETVSATLSQSARSKGLVVIIDDLHWADPSSAQLLAHLGRDLSTSRMLVIATYRDQEIGTGHPASAALATLGRERGTVTLRLRGLAEVEIADQLEATFARRFDVGIVAGIARRCDGNPFFVGQIGQLLDQAARAGQLDDSSWETAVPEGARAVIVRRLDRLSPAGRELLRTAAVAGTTIDPRTLAAVCNLPAANVLDHIDDAAEVGLLTRGTEAIEFSHALVRDTLAGELLTSQRVAIHRRIAEHLEAEHGADLDRHAPALAHHWLSALPAGDPRRAVAWAERAATNALHALAYEEAAQLYGRALNAMRFGSFEAGERGRVLASRAEALLKSGEITSAIACATDAGKEARAAGDPLAMARALASLEGMSDVSWAEVAVELAEDALKQLAEDEVETRARLLAVLASQASLLEGDDRADAVSRQALELAEKAGTPAALMSALRSRQMARADADGVQDRLQAAERMLNLAANTRDAWAALWGRLWRVDASCQLGDLDTAEADLARLTEIAARLRQPVADWQIARTSCAVAMGRGRFADADRYLDEAATLAARNFDPRAQQLHAAAGCRLALLTGDSKYDRYSEMLEAAGEPASRPMYYANLARLFASRGELDQAADRYHRLGSWKNWRAPYYVSLIAYNERARVAVALGDIEGAAIAYERLRPWAGYFVAGGSGLVFLGGSTQLTLGLLAATLGKVDLATRHLRSAIDANQRAGMPPYEAEARFELAGVLSRRSGRDRSEALVLAMDAAGVAARLGMKPLRAKAGGLVDALQGATARTGTAPLALTRREAEIAQLIGRGLTNRQIADVLHISERTAENHVQHILTKLNLQNRSQVAAWVTARQT